MYSQHALVGLRRKTRTRKTWTPESIAKGHGGKTVRRQFHLILEMWERSISVGGLGVWLCCLQRLLLLLQYTVWVKNPAEDLWQFFENGWEFFNQILFYAYYAFLPAPDFEFLFNYLQLWRSYAILSTTTQFTSCAQNVHHRPKHTLALSDIFPKQLGNFRPNFTRLLNVHTYARMQIFYWIISNCDEVMPY